MTSILWLTGSAGVGKSVTAWHAFTAPISQELGYIDVDQVGMLYPEIETDEYGYPLKNEAVTALVPNFTAAGARRLLASGVVDPREPEQSIRLDQADLRYCLLTVEDEVLRRRILERGWESSDADEIVAEQAELAASNFAQAVIDTTGQSVVAVAEQVLAEFPAGPSARSKQDDGDVLKPITERTLFITGPRVVGCSTVGFGLARHAWTQGTRTGFADLEQLSFLRTPRAIAHTDARLGLTNLATLVSVFTSRGAEVFIGNGHLRDGRQVAALRQHLPGVFIIRLRAKAATLRSHILDRLGGNDARLAGDDLADADAEHQEAVLAQALREQQQMDDAGIGDLVQDVDDTDPDAVISTITQFTTL